jgi:fatty-acyl-CoA synthase
MDSELRRQTLADLLHRSAKRFPNKTAIICGDTAWSYATFDALCNRLATGLAARAVRKGTRVAILSRNSHGFARCGLHLRGSAPSWSQSISC